MSQPVRYEIDDEVAWVTIDRPEARNALNAAVRSGLFEAIERFDADVAPGALQPAVLGARLIRALSVRHFEERDVVYTIPLTQNTVGFVSLVGSNLDRGKVGSFELAALEASGKTAAEPALRVASFKGEGFDARRILAAMSELSWRPGQPVGRLALEHASATGFGGEVFTRYGVSLGSVSIDVMHEGDAIVKSSTKFEGFVMVPPALRRRRPQRPKPRQRPRKT